VKVRTRRIKNEILVNGGLGRTRLSYVLLACWIQH